MTNALLYAVTVLVWGSTWLAIEFQLGTVAPEVSVFYRYGLAALLLFGWCRIRHLPLGFDLRAHGYFALLGLCLFGLNYLLTYYAQQHITSALTAIAFSTMLWMNIINARIFFGTRIELRVVLGSILGIAGIVALFLPEIEAVSWSDATLLGASLCSLGALIASLGNMVSQAAQRRALPVMQSNAWGMLYGAAITGGLTLLTGRPFAFDLSAGYVLSLLYLVVFGSIVAFGAYLTLLGRIGAHKSGYAFVMFPVVAVVLSAMFEGLDITVNVLLGVVLVVAGNLVTLDGAAKAAPRAGFRRLFRRRALVTASVGE